MDDTNTNLLDHVDSVKPTVMNKIQLNQTNLESRSTTISSILTSSVATMDSTVHLSVDNIMFRTNYSLY